MRKKLRIAAMLLLGLIFAGSIGMLIYRNAEYKEGEETYAEAEALVQMPDLEDLSSLDSELPEDGADLPVYVDPYADALRNMDFTALREVNAGVLGWIMIPGTVVSYPLLQGADNTYYLTHTWKKWTSAVGAIFMDCQNSRDLSDFNTIIYGHRMNNGSMFASLKNYKKQSYWSAHPYIYITDDNGSYRYDIFAAYEVSTAGKTYQIGFSGDEAKQAFLDYCLEQSVISTGITPTVHDRVVTLSTCTGNGHATRWVVQGRLKGVAPSDTAGQEETAPDAAQEQPAAGTEAPAAEEPPVPPAETAQTPASQDENAPDALTGGAEFEHKDIPQPPEGAAAADIEGGAPATETGGEAPID
jgi:sortase B